MYAHFYQLAENPFNLTPDPKFHYINEATREAMASILHGIKARKGFITLIGEAGTGKTTLLKRILDEIEGETQVVFVFNPGVSFDELLEFICMELGISTDGRRRLQLLDRLNAHLLEQLTAGRNVVVMIDEAQTLEDGVLEELRLLSNLETSKEKILQILLSGQPELEEKLRRPNLRQLRQRIAARATLKPMRPEEIGPYVETRLRSAGAERNDFFTPPALRKVWQASRGIPRVVNVVCDNAMMIAFAEGKRRITSRVMSEAIRDLHGRGSGAGALDTMRAWLTSPNLRYVAGVALGLALAVPFAMSIGSSTPEDAITETAAPAPIAAPTPPPNVSAPQAAAGAGAQPSAGGPQGAPAAAPSVDTDLRMSGTLRDSMRRAEAVARSTAARLYNSDSREVEPNAQRELHEPAAEDDHKVAPSPAGNEGEAIASLDEPVKFEREDGPLALDPKNDGKGLALLQEPLGDEESGAFDGDYDHADSASGAPDEEEEADSGAAPVRDAQRKNAAGGGPEDLEPDQKPVKAGSVELDTAAADAASARAEAAAKARAEQAKAKKEEAEAAKAKAQAEAKAKADAAAKARAEADAKAKAEADAQAKADAEAARKAAEAEQTRKLEQAAAEAANAEQPVAKSEDAEATDTLLASAEAAAQARADLLSPPLEAPSVDGPMLPEANDSPGPLIVVGPGAGDEVGPLPEGSTALASVPELETGLRTFGVDPNEPIVGQLVRVLPGDTVWDIAVAYYGTAGPVTLKRILNSNPTIRDPRHLDVGNHIYLPFQRPEQMVISGAEGSYRILLAVSPDESRLGPVRAWVQSFIDNAQFAMSPAGGGERSYHLHLIGLPSRQSALEFATEILAHHDQRRQVGRRSA